MIGLESEVTHRNDLRWRGVVKGIVKLGETVTVWWSNPNKKTIERLDDLIQISDKSVIL